MLTQRCIHPPKCTILLQYPVDLLEGEAQVAFCWELQSMLFLRSIAERADRVPACGCTALFREVEELNPLLTLGNGNMVYEEVMLWTNRGIWAQVTKGHMDSRAASLFTYKLWDVRSHMDGLFGFVSGTVPFAYYHLLNLILLLYLFMLAYAFVFVSPYWSIPGFFLVLVGLLWIRELGNAMSNPLGHDDTDIPIFDMASEFLKRSAMLINRESTYPDELPELKPATKAGGSGEASGNGLEKDH